MESTQTVVQTLQATQTETLPDTMQKQRTRCEVWTRVMGYHRPVSHFNIGKKAEHYSRKHFEETITSNSNFALLYS